VDKRTDDATLTSKEASGLQNEGISQSNSEDSHGLPGR